LPSRVPDIPYVPIAINVYSYRYVLLKHCNTMRPQTLFESFHTTFRCSRNHILVEKIPFPLYVLILHYRFPSLEIKLLDTKKSILFDWIIIDMDHLIFLNLSAVFSCRIKIFNCYNFNFPF
jgi:hypothetical protein